MRFISEKWVLGPLVALVAVYGVWIFGSLWADSRARDLQNARVEQVYRLAAQGQYGEILRLGLMDQESVDFMKREDRLFGPIKRYHIVMGDRWTPSQITVERVVARTPESMVLRQAGPMSFTEGTLHNRPRTPPGKPKINAAQALAVWKKMIHEGTTAAGGEATVRQVGDVWAVAYQLKPVSRWPEKRILVLSAWGDMLQDVATR